MRKQGYMALILLISMIVNLSFAEARPAAKDFPTRSVIIGTYVIDYKALNPKTIDLAQATVESSGQKKILYKSDLTTSKVWVDITSGESISDISDKSPNIVSDALIAAIPLTHWIKEDGSVVVFETGAVTSINDLHNLLDPRANDMLQKLVIDYDLAKELFDADDEDIISERTKNILGPVLAPLGQTVIEGYDKQLDSWDDFIAYLSSNGGTDLVLSLAALEKENTFTYREIAVDNALLGRLYVAADSAVKNGLNALNADIWEAIGKVESDASEKADTINSDNSTLLALYRLGQEQSLTQAITNIDYKTAQVAITQMSHVDHITSDLVLDKPSELQILMIVFTQSINKIKTVAAEGKGDLYYTALKNLEPAATLKVVLDAQIAKLKETVDEFKLIINYILARLDKPEEEQAIMAQALDEINKAMAAVPKDDQVIGGAGGSGTDGTATGADTGAGAENGNGGDGGTGTGTDAGTGAGGDGLAGTPSGTDESSMVTGMSPEDLLSAIKDGLSDQLNQMIALSDPETMEQVAYLEALKDKSDNLYKAFLGALENNDTGLADEIQANMDTLTSQQDALYNSFAGLYLQTNDEIASLVQEIADNMLQMEGATDGQIELLAAENDDLQGQIDALKGLLAKYALLLSPTDQQILAIYLDALVTTKEAINEGDIGTINDEINDLLTIYALLPDALKPAGDLTMLTSALISASKDAFLANMQDQGDALLALTLLLSPDQIAALLALADGDLGQGETGAVGQGQEGSSEASAGSGDDGESGTGSGEGTGTGLEAGTGLADGSGTNIDNIPSMVVTRNDAGQYILVKVPTIEIQGVTYVPIKTFYNLFNLDVYWHPENRSVEVNGLMEKEIFIEDSQIVKKGDVPFVMDYQMKIISGVSYAPLTYYTTDIKNFIMPNISDLTLIILPLK